MPRCGAQCLTELVLLGLLNFNTEEVSRHPVGLVDHHQIPVGLAETFDEVLAAGDLIDTTDQPVSFLEHITNVNAVDHVLRNDLEPEAELVEQLVLPLGDEAAGCDHKNSLGVSPDDQFLDVKASHDRLAGAGIVRQEESQRLARQHLTVDRFDLVRQRVDFARRQRQVGIEEVSQLDAPRLGSEAEHMAVTVEAPGAPSALFDGEGSLVNAVQQLLPRLVGGVSVGKSYGLVAMPGGRDHSYGPTRFDPVHDRSRYQIFKLRHVPATRSSSIRCWDIFHASNPSRRRSSSIMRRSRSA